jgi:hypothetical protein
MIENACTISCTDQISPLIILRSVKVQIEKEDLLKKKAKKTN